MANFERHQVGRYHLDRGAEGVGGGDLSLRAARAAGDGRPYVVELLEPPSERETSHFLTQLLAEAPSAVGFRHPGAVRVREVDPARLAAEGVGPAVVAYDPAPGHALSAILARAESSARTLPVRLVLHVALSVGDVLRALEQTPWRVGTSVPMGHGALSPRRVWVDPAGVVRVGSVGLARTRLRLAPPLDVLALRAPELAEDASALSPAADVHALGMLVFDLLFGRSVHLRDSAEETRRSVERGIRPRLARVRADVDPHLEALVEWMLAHRPAERPQSLEVVVQMLADALRRLSHGSSPAQHAAAWVGQLFPSGAAWPGGGAQVEPAAPPGESMREEDLADVLAPAPTPTGSAFSAGPDEDELAALAPAPVPISSGGVPIEIAPAVDDLDIAPLADAPPWLAPDEAAPLAGAPPWLAPDEAAPLAAVPTPRPRLESADAVPGFYEVFEVDALLEGELEAPAFEDRYVTLGPVGDGAWSRARDRVTAERVLVEPLPPHDPLHLEARQRLLRPVPRHPRLLTPIAVWPSSDGASAVSADLEGAVTLAERVDRRGPLALVEAARFVEQLLDGLGALHQAGVPHGALHPAAILVRGEGPELAIGVGGLLHAVGSEHLEDPAYIAPEQARGGRPTLSGDVWSAAAVAWFALLGAGPFAAASRQSLACRVDELPPPSIRVARPAARRFDPFFRSALEPRIEFRAASARALARSLEAVPTAR